MAMERTTEHLVSLIRKRHKQAKPSLRKEHVRRMGYTYKHTKPS